MDQGRGNRQGGEASLNKNRKLFLYIKAAKIVCLPSVALEGTEKCCLLDIYGS